MSNNFELYEYEPPEADNVVIRAEPEDTIRITREHSSPHVGDIPLDAITGVSSSSPRNFEEIDLVDREKPVVLMAERSFEELEISFVLLPWGADIDEKREMLKELNTRDAIENDFTYLDFKGYLSVESVDVNQTGDEQTVRTGTINARYLPWPEYYGDQEPTSYEFFLGRFEGDMSLDGEITYLVPMDGRLDLLADFDGRINFQQTISGSLDGTYPISGYLSKESDQGQFGQSFGQSFGGG